MPLVPAISAAQVAGAVSPTGVTAPRPVIATLRMGVETGMRPK
jgi:hypothetical protein